MTLSYTWSGMVAFSCSFLVSLWTDSHIIIRISISLHLHRPWMNKKKVFDGTRTDDRNNHMRTHRESALLLRECMQPQISKRTNSGRRLILRPLLLLLLCLFAATTPAQSLTFASIMGQTISATQFFVYGKRHFTKTGYLKHVSAYYKTPPPSSPSAAAAADDAIDLTNKVVVVTGANSGLGKQVATYVASKGATLYMLCRSKDRAETARTEILKDTQCNADKVKVVLADVSELEQVRTVVSQITEPEVHCLVCNAGVLLNEQSNSSEGLEATFASHLLGGTYLLTTLLMPKLSAAQNGRVVVVTSGGMYTTALPSWDVMTSYTSNLGEAPSTSPPEQFKYDGTMAYAYAKRGQVVLVEEWSKVYPKMNFCTVHPGWTDTPAVDDAFGDKKKYLEPLREPWQGAEGVAWLTGCSNVESGELYLDRKVQKKHIAGPFMSEGSFTKNTAEEIEEFMANLKRTAGV